VAVVVPYIGDVGNADWSSRRQCTILSALRSDEVGGPRRQDDRVDGMEAPEAFKRVGVVTKVLAKRVCEESQPDLLFPQGRLGYSHRRRAPSRSRRRAVNR
jgi:hypothetical protein